MRTDPVNRRRERVTIEALMRYAEEITANIDENSGKLKALIKGQGIRECTVRQFYEPFLRVHSADKSEAESGQRWIEDSIEVMTGEADVRTMTMGGLADRIAAALNTTQLSSEDRWALYELCFMLTAQMRIGFDDSFRIIEQTTRIGTPDEKEPRSLYSRVIALRRERREDAEEAGPRTGKRQRVSLEKLLQSVRGREKCLSEKDISALPMMEAEEFVRSCLMAKYNNGHDTDGGSLDVDMEKYRFEAMIRQYSGKLKDYRNSVAEFAEQMTCEFRDKAERRGVSRTEMLQAYELCYEFIALMAGEECSEGHMTLMMTEGPDRRF